MKKYFTIILACTSLLLADAGDFSINGKLTGFLQSPVKNWEQTQLGIRYFPKIDAEFRSTPKYIIDGQFSLNTSVNYDLETEEPDNTIKPYRLWLRFSTDQFETRIGLQKINFGSALMLRPLMWFDSIDPRDPLQLTDGVWGVLTRYYFINNANIWLWGLYGNDERKGMELMSTQNETLEFGGRIQHPFLNGELAATFHRRKMDTQLAKVAIENFPNDIPENRIAIDGKWDYEIGIWFESALTWYEHKTLSNSRQLLTNFGADYTFPIGNGLHVLGEYFIYDISNELLNINSNFPFTAIMADYSLSMFDQLSALIFYDIENQQIMNYLNWNKTYDNWSYYFSIFKNPDQNQFAALSGLNGVKMLSGLGFRFIFEFNH